MRGEGIAQGKDEGRAFGGGKLKAAVPEEKGARGGDCGRVGWVEGVAEGVPGEPGFPRGERRVERGSVLEEPFEVGIGGGALVGAAGKIAEEVEEAEDVLIGVGIDDVKVGDG